MATDPRWVNIAEKNIEEILTDHAFCEQKAASYGISIIVQYPEKTELVSQLLEIVSEELDHFKQVHQIIVKRGFTLGKERKDPYVNDLKRFFAKGSDKQTLLVYKLLLAAMIEARSCERFKVLSENIGDSELAEFYRALMISEANHYTFFIAQAKKVAPQDLDVDDLWKAFLEFEAKVILKYGQKEQIHG